MSDSEWEGSAPDARGAPRLAELVELHDRDLIRMCVVAGASPEMAREAVQNTWLRASTRMRTVRQPERVRAWLISIALNELRQLWRRQKLADRRSASLDLVADVTDSGGGADLDLAAALAKLPLRDRELISLTVLIGLNSAEAGKILGLSAAGVRTRKARVLTTLREELEG